MAAWLKVTSPASDPGQVHIAIELPHGPVVERLIERGFKVHAIDPKQMDGSATGLYSRAPRTTAVTRTSWPLVSERIRAASGCSP